MASHTKALYISRSCVALVLIIAAVLKLSTSGDPPRVFTNNAILDLLLSDRSSLTFAVIELVLGLFLFTRWWRPSMCICLALSIVFIAFILVLDRYGVDASACGCFGGIQISPAAHYALLFGIAMVALGALMGYERSAAP